MPAIFETTAEGLRDWFVEQGLPAYRAVQVRKWLFARRACSFEEMTDLPAELRRRLTAEWGIWTSRVVNRQQAADGSEKLLLEFPDAEHIECVLLRDDKGHCTACISTQVGCAMGCAFCATGLEGLVRNLSTGEIIEQLLHVQRLLGNREAAPALLPAKGRQDCVSRQSADERLSHVVVMGMGEPLLNLEALLPALAAATDRNGLGLSARRITISTVGLPAGIRRLAKENCQYHLAVSLHAADDELRNRLVPANRGFGVAAIIAAADDYFARTGRRVTFEYVLLAGINDHPHHAEQLVRLVGGRPALVNLIPCNPVAGLPYRAPSPSTTARFAALLTQSGITVAIRHRKGDRIRAACGQLRRR